MVVIRLFHSCGEKINNRVNYEYTDAIFSLKIERIKLSRRCLILSSKALKEECFQEQGMVFLNKGSIDFIS